MEKMKLNIQLFNGSVAIQTITETTDIYTNQSTFTIPAKMTTTGSTYNNSNASMTMQWKYESDSSWTSLNKQTFGIGKSSSKTKSWTLTLTHNNDGTLENVQFRVKWYITDSTNGTTGATTYTPTTIPRGSEFDTLNWNRDTQILLNSTISIPAIQHISPAYHKLEARFMINGNEQLIASWTGVSITNGYISFSFNSSQLSTIYNLMPSETTHYIRMYLYTYSDSSYSTLIGEESVIWWTGLIPDNVVPVAHMSYSEGGDTPSSWGVYVKGKSKLNLILTGSGTASSTITSYLISGDGYTYNSNTALTNYLSKSGNITFTGIVTDSRGRQGSWDVTIYALDYYNPSISTAQVQRCDENGNIDRNGEYLYISYGANISSCGNRNKANAHYKVGYRVQDTGSYQYVDLASNVDSYSATGMLYTDGIYAADRGSGTKVQFSTSNTFDIQFYVDDTFNPNGQTNTQQLDTGFDLMNFNPSGKAMAIGKVSEAGANQELLEIGMTTEITPPANVYSGLTINSSNYNEGSIAYNNQDKTKSYVFGYGTGSIDGMGLWSHETGQNVLTINKDGNVSAKQSFRIPVNSNNGYGLVDHADNSIIKDWDNGTITMDATGGDLFLGFQNTNNINIFNGKASFNNAGGFHAKTIQQQIVSNGTGGTSGVYIKLCNLTFGFHNQGEFANFRIYIGDGNNGRDNQNAFIDLTMQLGWTGNYDGRLGCNWELHPLNTNFDLDNVNIIVIANSNINYDIYLWTNKYYCNPNYTYDCSSNVIITNDGATSTTYPSGTQCEIRGEVIGNTAQIGDTSLTDTPHHFQIGEILICFGKRDIHSVANDTATDTVGFGAYFRYPPIVTITAMTGAPNTYEKGAGVTNITTSTFDITHYRTNNTTTSYQWIAIGLRA